MTDVELYQSVIPEDLLSMFKEPPKDPCFIKGPRGGLYVAVGEWTVKVAGPGADYRDPLSQRWVAIFSADTRYLRPRSRLWEQAMASVG